MVKLKFVFVLLIVGMFVVPAGPVFAGRESVLKKVRISFLREEYQQTAKECERLLSRERLDSNMKAELYYLAGVSYLKQNKFHKARDNLLKLILRYERTEFIDDAYLSLGDSYFLSGSVSNAIIKYREFISKYPRSELLHLAYYRLGESYYRTGQWKGARIYLKKVIKVYPQSYEADKAQALLDKGLYYTLQVGAFLRNAPT